MLGLSASISLMKSLGSSLMKYCYSHALTN